MKLDITKIEQDIGINLTKKEKDIIQKYIEDNIVYFDKLKNIDTSNVKVMNFPFDLNIAYEDLREDNWFENDHFIKENTSNFDKNNYIVYHKDLKINESKFKVKKIVETNNWKIGEIKEQNFKKTTNLLLNVPIAIKDNIAIKGEKTSCGSIILANFKPNFNATIVEKLLKAGAKLKVKTNMDELGMGGSGIFTPFGPVVNPHEISRIAGGSSSGSAFAVGSKKYSIAIGTDTGDSVRKPAAYVGVYGFKPTYSLVSRYGMFDYSPSLDCIAWFSDTVLNSAKVMDVLVGKDWKDATSQNPIEKNYSNFSPKIKGLKVGYIKDLLNQVKDENIINNFNKSISNLEELGLIVKPITFNIKLLEMLWPVYQAISFSEGWSCNLNLQGLLFGEWNKNVMASRASGLGLEVKKRFAISAFVLDNEHQEVIFKKAKKIRRMIVNEYEKILKDVDVLLVPANTTVAPFIKEIKPFFAKPITSWADDILVLANFSGSPSMTIPNGTSNEMPTAINLMGRPFEDAKIFNIAFALEQKGEK